MDNNNLRKTIYETILDLATDLGINASGRDDIYGCIFGRDSAITILKILRVCSNRSLSSEIEINKLLEICKKGLNTLITLQGKETNIESGEEPGKFIHEYRPDNYERLLQMEKPWYVYPDGILRNYDSIDSTPLCLIAIYRYWEITKDDEFMLAALPSVEAGLNWIITYADKDKDYLLEYELSENRQHGGLSVQSWTDSQESMINPEGKFPEYPIAPVEVQGYAWLALQLWSDYYQNTKINYSKTKRFGRALKVHANLLKRQFNKFFIFKENGSYYAAQALDGYKNQIKTVTGNPLLLLWAAYKKNGKVTSIIEKKYLESIVKRAFTEDMFDEDAGIRTMSTKARTFIPGSNSYHNGSFWPKLNGMSHEGLENFGYWNKAQRLKDATLKPIQYFGTPIELYIKTENGQYDLYHNPNGQRSCREQAWSAAAALDLLTNQDVKHDTYVFYDYDDTLLNLRLVIHKIAETFKTTEIRNIKNYLRV